jgi:hypothetical protein
VSAAKARAVSLLEHYLQQAGEAAGLRWGPDNSAEVAAITDHLVAGGRDEISAAVDHPKGSTS